MPRARVIAIALTRAIGLVALFASALVAGVILHLDTPATRQAIASHVTAALAPTFEGRIAIERIDHIGLTGVDGARATVDDSTGVHVIVVDGLSARIETFALMRSLVGGRGPLAIDLTRVSIRSADVSLDADPSGGLRLAKAFARRPASTPSSPATPGRGVRFSLDGLAITHAHVHGQPDGAPPLDVDLDTLAASIAVVPGSTTLEVGRVDVTTRGMPHGADARGVAHASVSIPAPGGSDVAVRGAWEGAVGEIAQTVTFGYDGQRVDIVVDAPAVSADHVRLLWPDSPIVAPASVHAEAHGPLTAVDVRFHVDVADGTVEAVGSVSIGIERIAKLHIDARGIDLNAIVEGAPSSKIALAGDAVATARVDGSLAGSATIEVSRSELAGVELPATTLQASASRDDAHGLTVDSTVTPHEAGVVAKLDVHLRPKGASLEATFDAAVFAARIDEIARVRPSARGSGAATAHGSFDFASRRVDARVQAHASGVSSGTVRVASASFTASATGAVGSPFVVGDARATDCAIGSRKIESVRATASGTLPTLHATVALRAHDLPSVDARADIDLETATTLRNVDAALSRNGERAHARVAVLRVAPTGVDAEKVVLDGVGAPALITLRTTPHSIALRAVSAGLDIGRLARLLGVHDTIDGDTAAFDIDATLRDGGADGHIGAKVSRCTIRGVGDVSGTFDTTLSGRRAVGQMHVALGDIASLDANFNHVELGSGSSPSAALRGAWGSINFAGRGNLARIRTLIPDTPSSLGELSGTLVLEGHVLRESAVDETPELSVSGYTSNLEVGAAHADGASPPWRFVGIDLGIDARIDGTSGAAEVSVRAQDSKGVLASLDAKATDLPYSDLLATPDRAMALVEAVPLQARVDVPRRSVSDFPDGFALGGVQGDLTATFTVEGTLGKPSVDGSVTLDHARSKLARLETPLDVVATLHYDAVRADVRVSAEVRKRQVLDADVRIDAAFGDLIDTERRDPMPWTASAKARVDRFPLKSIATLDDRDVRGEVSGDVTMDGIHDDGSATLSLDVGALTIGDVKYRKAWLRANVGGQTFDASVRLEQADGFAEAHASAGTQWGRAIAPRIDGTRPIKLSLVAKAFRASTLLPFAANVLTELDGRIDGNAAASIDLVARKASSHGILTLSGGQVEVAAFGGELHDIAATLAWTPDGLIQIPKLTARVASGEIDASGSIRLDGLALASANFVVDVPKKKRVPLTLEGIQLATVDGRFEIEAATSGADHALHATIDVPTLHADLPVTGSRTAQALATMDHVTIGVRGRDGVVRTLAGEALGPVAVATTSATPAAPVTIAIKLGKDVEIRRGTDLRVSLEGAPIVTVGDSTRVTGQIRLPRGSLDVDGKPFTIDNGTVTFVGDDPTNPQIVLTAEWSASEGTTVFADFVGPLKTGKVTLRSDPAHTKSEILALILYGTADGQAGSTSDSAPGTTAAAGAAGGIATQPVNRILDDFGLAGGISTKIDTSTANPRPEVEFQIARDISIQIAWVLGAPLGSNPDTTFVTFDWRFLQRWSLETTVGDAGTSILDVVWKYHY